MIEHVERLRVAWVDTDAGGRIHFTAPLRYAEAAEAGLRRKLGALDGWGNYPRRHVEVDYRAVLRFDDEVEVSIRPERVGTTSITWVWQIHRGDELCVDGRMTVVHVDENGRPVELPERVRVALA